MKKLLLALATIAVFTACVDEPHTQTLYLDQDGQFIEHPDRNDNLILYEIREEKDDYYQVIEAQEVMADVLARADSNIFLQSVATTALIQLQDDFRDVNGNLIDLYKEAAPKIMKFDSTLNYTYEIPGH